MNKESSRPIDTLLNLSCLGVLSLAIFANFTLNVRHKIKDRAFDKFGKLASELSGNDDEPLECAHWDHSPKNPRYNHPSNGRLLTLSEHLRDHIQREGNNGLSIKDNQRAIATLRKRLKMHYKESKAESHEAVAAR